MKVEDLKKAIEFNIEYNSYKDDETFRFASLTMVRGFPPLYIAVDVSKECYSLDFQNGYNNWSIGGCVEDYNKNLDELAKKLYNRLVEDGLIKVGIKVNIIFLDQKVCDNYDFIQMPDSEAIRPSIDDIELKHHTKKAILVHIDNKDYWIAKSLIRSISKTGDSHSIFENEPYYDKYVDNIKLESIENRENDNV